MAWWCGHRNGRRNALSTCNPELLQASRSTRAAVGRARRRLAVDQHHGGAAARSERAGVEDRLQEAIRAAADLLDRGADLDLCRASAARRRNRSPAARRRRWRRRPAVRSRCRRSVRPGRFRNGREHRVVDVPLAIEIAVTDDVGHADGKAFERRSGGSRAADEDGWCTRTSDALLIDRPRPPQGGIAPQPLFLPRRARYTNAGRRRQAQRRARLERGR